MPEVKLSPDQRREIGARAATESATELAREFDIHVQRVYQLKREFEEQRDYWEKFLEKSHNTS